MDLYSFEQFEGWFVRLLFFDWKLFDLFENGSLYFRVFLKKIILNFVCFLNDSFQYSMFIVLQIYTLFS